MNEVELMAQHSATYSDRAKWSFEGNSPGSNTVYTNRILGLSDDGLRVIGKEASDLPGGSRFKEEQSK